MARRDSSATRARRVDSRSPRRRSTSSAATNRGGCGTATTAARSSWRADDPVQHSLFDDGETPGPRYVRLALWCDGGSRGNPGPAAIGAVVADASTDPPTVLAEVSETIGVATNNVAEYR